MLKASKYEASHKIRFLRVVKDDDVDRMQVYRQRCHSRALLIARSLLVLLLYVWVYTFSVPFFFLRAVIALLFLHHVCLIQVTIALRFHLFPFRTEKLSSVTPMVLRNSGRVGSCRFLKPLYSGIGYRGFLFWYPNHTHHHHATHPSLSSLHHTAPHSHHTSPHTYHHTHTYPCIHNTPHTTTSLQQKKLTVRFTSVLRSCLRGGCCSLFLSCM